MGLGCGAPDVPHAGDWGRRGHGTGPAANAGHRPQLPCMGCTGIIWMAGCFAVSVVYADSVVSNVDCDLTMPGVNAREGAVPTAC